MGYAVGALIAGGIADRLGYGSAIAIVAALTAVSGLWVLWDMPATTASTLRDSTGSGPGVGPMTTSNGGATIP